jgi:hypothetical protein
MSRVSHRILLLLVCASVPLPAQENNDVPLGDIARSVRKARPAEEKPVIDNDNLAVMMDKAESERLNRKPVFSIDPSGKTFRMTSPDGSCSISFDARATALISVPYVASDLPQDELLKLEGPAAIHDGVLEVSLHNGTGWEVKEILVGVTTLENQSEAEAQLEPAKLIASDPAAVVKFPDLTTLYHLKASAPADSTTIFRTNLAAELDTAKDWHWALVAARGIPPAATSVAPAAAVAGSATPSGEPQPAASLPPSQPPANNGSR